MRSLPWRSRREAAAAAGRGSHSFLTLSLVLGLLVPSLCSARASFDGVAGAVGSAVAAGYGNLSYSSSNYAVWYPAAGVDSTLLYTAVIRSGGRYLAAAADGSVWVSEDGTGTAFHQAAQVSTLPLWGLCVVGSRVLAVGDGGHIAISSDLLGGSWESVTSPVTAPLRAAAWNGVNTVAVGDEGVLLRAGADAANWQQVIISESHSLLSVATSPAEGTPGQYIVVGDGGVMWSGEPDGSTWTSLTSPVTTKLYGVTRVGLATVIVGQNATILYSAGGNQNWTLGGTSVSVTLRGVTFTGGAVVAVGDLRTVIRSEVGLTWTESAVPVSPLTWGALQRRFAGSAR